LYVVLRQQIVDPFALERYKVRDLVLYSKLTLDYSQLCNDVNDLLIRKECKDKLLVEYRYMCHMEMCSSFDEWVQLANVFTSSIDN
jgi:hypothetical protein